jgi:regulator of nonsense transcripts 2
VLITDILQTRTVELPSDSTFAVAMKTQQQAEREEQQRIKNLVLNYDLRESEDPDGDTTMTLLTKNTNIHNMMKAGPEKTATYHINRPEKQGKDRGGQRVRRLEMNDLDWYGNTRDNNKQAASQVESSTRVEPSDEMNFPSKRSGRIPGSQARCRKQAFASHRARAAS